MMKSEINFFGASYHKNEDRIRSPIIPREGESSDNDFSLLQTNKGVVDDPFRFRRSPPSTLALDQPNLQQISKINKVMGDNPVPTHILTRGYNDEIISRELPKVSKKKKEIEKEQHQFTNPLLKKREKKREMKLPPIPKVEQPP